MQQCLAPFQKVAPALDTKGPTHASPAKNLECTAIAFDRFEVFPFVFGSDDSTAFEMTDAIRLWKLASMIKHILSHIDPTAFTCSSPGFFNAFQSSHTSAGSVDAHSITTMPHQTYLEPSLKHGPGHALYSLSAVHCHVAVSDAR